MLAILKALIRIAKNLERIRFILEVAHRNELESYAYYEARKKELNKDSDREFIVKEPELDLYEQLDKDIAGRKLP